MSIWDEFSDDELHVILECDKLKEIKRKFRHKFNRERWLAYARAYYELNQHPDFSTERLILSINDGSIGALTLLSIIGSITVLLIPLTIITSVLTLTSVAASIYFLIDAYRAGKDESHQTIKDFDLLALKIQCANEIIHRKKDALTASPNYRHESAAHQEMYPVNDYPEFEYKNKNKMKKVTPAIKLGLLTGALLFGTYYCGLAVTLSAFGLVAVSGAMLGPIGIGIALGTAITIGVFCAYKRYRAIVAEDHVLQFQGYQKDIFKDKRSECYNLQLNTNRLISQPIITQRTVSRTQSSPNIAFFNTRTDHKQHDLKMNKPALTYDQALRMRK